MKVKHVSILLSLALLFTTLFSSITPAAIYAAEDGNGANLALGKTATSSGNEDPVLGPEKAVDGMDNTRWSSATQDDQWFSVDLGEERNINRIIIHWQDSFALQYKLLVSNDNENWVNVYANDKILAGSGGEQVIDFGKTAARYVKFQGIQRATQWGYSFYEFKVYEADIPNYGVNHALGKQALSSGNEVPSLGPGNAVDGQGDTRWSSALNNEQWFSVDLGEVMEINRIVLNWHTHAKKYKLLASTNNTDWIDVTGQDEALAGNRGIEVIDFDKINARFVKFQGIERSTQWGYSFYEFEVYNYIPYVSELSDEEAVAADAAAIDLPNVTDIYKNLYLFTAGKEGSTIVWESSNPDYLRADGILVQRPAPGQPQAAVTLTATITKGDVTEKRVFEVTIKPNVVREAEPEQLRIGIYWPPLWEYTNAEQYKYMKEAGINTIENVLSNGLNTEERNFEMLDLAHANGMKVSVADPRVDGTDREIQEMVQTYMDHPATSGYYIKDEPWHDALTATAQQYKKILATDPDRVPYVNLNPNWSMGNYEHIYVRAWVEAVGAENMKYLSFDNYPFKWDGSFSTNYFDNLEIIRKVGLEYDIKTSSYLQSVGIPGMYRRPVAAEMEYSAYVNLAYGMKSLVWFTYWTPTERGEPFTDAIMTAAGEKTDLYAPVQEINAKVAKLGPTLVNLDAIQAYHAGPTIPAGVPALPSSFFIQPDSNVNSLVISHMKHKTTGESYVMIVNKSFTDGKQLSFTLDSSVRGVKEVSHVTGLETNVNFDPATGKLQAEFGPGEGRLYALQGIDGGYHAPQDPELLPAEAPPINPHLNAAKGRNVEVSSDVNAWGWNKKNAVDGVRTSTANSPGWSSMTLSSQPTKPEWIMVDLGQSAPVNKVSLWPRSGGGGFPVDYRILVSPDNQNWTEVAKVVDAPKPSTNAVHDYSFESVQARYVKVEASKLRIDELREYAFQLAELEIYIEQPDSYLHVQSVPDRIAVGGTAQLKAGMWQLSGSMPVTDAVFTSLNEEIASVSESGVVTGLAPGVATLQIATADDTETITLDLEVYALPSPWKLMPYGDAWGSVHEEDGALQIKATGRGLADKDYVYLHRELNGNKTNTMTMSLNRYQIPGGAAGLKGTTGLMMRDSLDENAAWVYLSISPQGRVKLESSPGNGTSTVAATGPYIPFPAEIKLVKTNHGFTGYYKKDSGWTPINGTEAASSVQVTFATGLTGGVTQFSGTAAHSLVTTSLPQWESSNDGNNGNPGGDPGIPGGNPGIPGGGTGNPDGNDDEGEDTNGETEEPTGEEPGGETEENPPGQGNSNLQFSDVAGHWAANAIERAVELGFVNGYEDGTFRPNAGVTRGELATILSRALQLPAAESSVSVFNDAIPAWASNHVMAAVQAGLFNGYEDHTFRVREQMPRAQIAAVIVRALGLPTDPMAQLTFTDAADVPGWARPYVAAGVEAGLMRGRGDNQFAPHAVTTRAEAVTLIIALLDYMAER
ncbi:discoidin domain-containing protein [Paenibacillus daejeonensis]|uniref:discoidin domain-containing protein n=1 Tax=Paenibacillus daejeonensis TaxID=135193 RepID=UPI0003748D1B|nr:discoidin domain-containing protein [Paenibacillus daejeonensis]